MINSDVIKPEMPVVCSNDVQFAVVDHTEGAESIKLKKDKQGHHHYIPMSWVKTVDNKVHLDRPGTEAMREWTTEGLTVHEWRPPYWKNELHGSAWDRVKGALKRDWEQTKADLGAKGHELNQSVVDTVKQAAGTETLPPSHRPNPMPVKASWHESEAAVRYGVAARTEYGTKFETWDDTLETTLSKEWNEQQTGRPFKTALPGIRKGWDSKDDLPR